jgi:hypothetical protein
LRSIFLLRNDLAGPSNNGKAMPDYDNTGLFYDAPGAFYDGPLVPTTKTNKKRMAKIKLNLSKRSVQEILQLANDIKTAMTGNTHFTTPNPSLTAIGTLLTTAQTKTNEASAAATTSKMKTDERNAAMDDLSAGLTQLAAYVESTSAGDPLIIQSAGMDVKSTPAPIGIPAQVVNVFLTASDAEGSLDAQWDPVRGAKSYEIQWSLDPITSTSWVGLISVTKSSAMLNSFTSGQRIWIRLRAIGAAGAGPWSDPAVKTVP